MFSTGVGNIREIMIWGYYVLRRLYSSRRSRRNDLVLQWVVRSFLRTFLRISTICSMNNSGDCSELVMWWQRRSSKSSRSLIKSLRSLGLAAMVNENARWDWILCKMKKIWDWIVAWKTQKRNSLRQWIWIQCREVRVGNESGSWCAVSAPRPKRRAHSPHCESGLV